MFKIYNKIIFFIKKIKNSKKKNSIFHYRNNQILKQIELKLEEFINIYKELTTVLNYKINYILTQLNLLNLNKIVKLICKTDNLILKINYKVVILVTLLFIINTTEFFIYYNFKNIFVLFLLICIFNTLLFNFNFFLFFNHNYSNLKKKIKLIYLNTNIK